MIYIYNQLKNICEGAKFYVKLQTTFYIPATLLKLDFSLE